MFEFLFSSIKKSVQDSKLGILIILIIQLKKSMILGCCLVRFILGFALLCLPTGMLCICSLFESHCNSASIRFFSYFWNNETCLPVN